MNIEILNVIIHGSQKEAINTALENNERVFIEPSHYLNNFMILKLHRYLVMPIPKKLYNVIDKKKIKNANVFDFNLNSKFKNPIQKTPFNILQRNLYKQSEYNIRLNLSELSETNTIHLTKESFIIFSWFLREKKEVLINDISMISSYSYSLEELIKRGVKDYIYNNVAKYFYPLVLERALKLYGSLYLSKEYKNKEKICFIDSLQKHLLGINSLKEINPLFIEKAISYFEKESEYFEKVFNFPSNNLVNKIIEELKHIEFLNNLKKQTKGNAYGFDYYIPTKDSLVDFEKKLIDYIFYGGEECPIPSPF